MIWAQGLSAAWPDSLFYLEPRFGFSTSPLSSPASALGEIDGASVFGGAAIVYNTVPFSGARLDAGVEHTQYDSDYGCLDDLWLGLRSRHGDEELGFLMGGSVGSTFSGRYDSEEKYDARLFGELLFDPENSPEELSYYCGLSFLIRHYPHRELVDGDQQLDTGPGFWLGVDYEQEEALTGGVYEFAKLISNDEYYEYAQHSLGVYHRRFFGEDWSLHGAYNLGILPYRTEVFTKRGGQRQALSADFSHDLSLSLRYRLKPELVIKAEADYNSFHYTMSDVHYDQVEFQVGLSHSFRLRCAEKDAGLAPRMSGNKATFNYWGQDAEKVSLYSSFNDWQEIEFDKRAAGEFRLRLELPEGTHSYYYLVDGERVLPPGAFAYVEDDFGGRQAVISAP